MSQKRAENWLSFAGEDLETARLALDDEIYNQVCFYGQQCVEKSLKSILAAKGGPLPRTHMLTDLLELAIKIAPALGKYRDGCLILDQYYIPTRYPDALVGSLPQGLPGKMEAQEALTTADNIYTFTKKLLKIT